MSDNKKVFQSEIEGKKVELAVMRPNHKVQQQAQLVYNRAFRQAVKPEDGKPGAIVRAALESVLREQKLWDNDKQKRFEEVNKKLLDGEKKLAQGGIKLKEAREMAIQMRRDRWELRQLLSDRNSLDLNTAEAQAENARFNYLVSATTVFSDTGKPYWKSEDDYLAATNDPVAGKAGNLLGNMLYGLEDNFEQKLPENRWLKKFKFVDESLHLVDKQGRLIDAQGRLVDDKGRLINERGELVDVEGTRLTEDGDYIVDSLPFLDDDGNPVPEPDAASPPIPSPAKAPTPAEVAPV